MLISLSLLLIPAWGRAAWIDVSERGSAAMALATVTKHMGNHSADLGRHAVAAHLLLMSLDSVEPHGMTRM